MDVDFMHVDMVDAMISGIENSTIVLVHLSRDYDKSVNCQMELKYAVSSKKQIITVRLDSGPYDRSKFLTGSDYTLYFDLVNVSNVERKETVFESLSKEIRKQLDILSKSINSGVISVQSEIFSDSYPSISKLDGFESPPPAYKASCKGDFATKTTNATHKPLLREIKKTLNPLDLSNDIEEIASRRQPATRDWIVDSVLNWALSSEPNTPQIFWLCGVAGCGKSVASAAIVTDSKFVVAASFFCKFDEEKRSNPRVLLNSLAFQLAEFDSGFATSLKDFIDDKPEFFTKSTKQTPLSSVFQHLIINPLKSLTSSGIILICIDALDESAPEASKERIEFLRLFSLAVPKLPANVKLLVTSRPGQDFEQHFRAFTPTILTLDSASNRADILVFARDRLGDLSWKISDPDLKIPVLAQRLSEISGGLFVWMFFALEELAGDDNVEAAVEQLAIRGVDLDEIYRTTLVRAHPNVNEEKIRLFQVVVGLLLVAKEPLEVNVLAQLVGIEQGVVKACLARISSLLCITDTAVTFMHKSVADFLISDERCFGDAAKFQVNLHQANIQAASFCLSALNKDWYHKSATVSQLVGQLSGNSFSTVDSDVVKYALTYWMHHLTDCGDNITDSLFDLLTEFNEKHGNIALLVGLKNRKSAVIKHLLLAQKQPPPFLIDAAENTGFFRSPLLYEAAKRGLSSVCKVLLEIGKCNVNCKGWTPEGSNSVGEMQRSALHVAVISGSLETVKVLINHGADINVQDKDGDTPRKYATGSIEIFFKSRFEDIENANILQTMTQFQKAVFLGDQEKVMDILKADVNQISDVNSVDGKVALHYAAARGHTNIAQIIITSNITSVNHLDKMNRTPLHWAADVGNAEIAILLINAQANLNLLDINYRMPLHLAARSNHVNVIRCILEHSADSLNAKTDTGFTPLHFACLNGHSDAVQALLDAGADVAAETAAGPTHLSLKTPLMLASLNGHTRIVSLLLSNGADPNARDSTGNSAIRIAARNGDIAVVRSLLQNGADINMCDVYDWTPLHCAARNGHVDVSRYLIAKGCLINTKDSVGRTALHIAAEMGHVELVRLLFEKGADVNALDDIKWTPLFLAVENYHVDTVRVLVNECGADTSIKDFLKQTALSKAVDKDFTNIVKILETVANLSGLRGPLWLLLFPEGRLQPKPTRNSDGSLG
ncbi:POC1 centriolar protein A [Physocladia obscura]|uniref:POC1 centriolar protein A n=1 Tax=Physocladia obscura TaxID=109957 RepID=A0AAD5TAC5_9FUNG|nr:POC1 centriolar protein A [Physocladia obscura]